LIGGSGIKGDRIVFAEESFPGSRPENAKVIHQIGSKRIHISSEISFPKAVIALKYFRL
jgi:hypothetical protein